VSLDDDDWSEEQSRVKNKITKREEEKKKTAEYVNSKEGHQEEGNAKVIRQKKRQRQIDYMYT